MPKALCANCGNQFDANAARKKYCQQSCYVEHTRKQAATSLIERFWAKVKKTRGCWLWTASTIRGYGQFHLPRVGATQQTIYAHRFAWQITYGFVPDNLFVLHKCDVPLCVNPNHLFLGTQAVNLDDARSKGRLVDGRHLIKVSDEGLRDIRENYQPRVNGKKLAKKYGISLVSVLRIVNGTQRVGRRKIAPVFERVPHVNLPVRGEVA